VRCLKEELLFTASQWNSFQQTESKAMKPIAENAPTDTPFP